MSNPPPLPDHKPKRTVLWTDATKVQLIAMWIGISLLVLSWLFPPFVLILGEERVYMFGSFMAQTLPIWHVDLPRLLVIDAIIILVGAGAIVTLRKIGK